MLTQSSRVGVKKCKDLWKVVKDRYYAPVSIFVSIFKCLSKMSGCKRKRVVLSIQQKKENAAKK
ncbi:hypothetical protein B7P43_G17415 [Cryptotermes secundus]|uniref:Uncharacterized protein n=1 Tax=Cryptotermes secundus TaxID=105785 RepID=A0A2J7QCS6_9NEOP|nr:hypothetical protein B7P43_G17415 [Cryptotermes secundus]